MNKISVRLACVTNLALITLLWNTMTSASRADSFDLLVSNYFGSSVQQIGDSGSNFTTLVPSGSGGLNLTTGVTIGPDGNVYVSSNTVNDENPNGVGQVLQYSPNGTFLSAFATLPDDYSPAVGGYIPAAPAHLQFYNGSLYVADNNGDSVEQFAVTKNPTTGALTAAASPTDAASGLYGAGSFTIAPNGDLYASSFAGPLYGDPAGSPPYVPAVVKVSNGVQTNFAYPATDESGNTASPVSPLDPAGLLFVHNTLLVVDLEGNNILKYDANGNYKGVFATIPGPADVPNNFPSDLVLSPDGKSIYVAVLGDGNPMNPMDPNPTPDGKVLQYSFTIDSDGLVQASGDPTTIASGFAASSVAIGVRRGDLNLDGLVDAADVQALTRALANLSDFESLKQLTDQQLDTIADVNGDGKITNADLQALLVLLQNQGGSSTASVPEPNAVALAGLALAALGFHTRRRRSLK
ncbi:MAG TPA: dockerin type I domain-containing protein [Pirellulales bacterium]|nr:dockerin type I domain-containing protein [Pirellulales bacterium]